MFYKILIGFIIVFVLVYIISIVVTPFLKEGFQSTADGSGSPAESDFGSDFGSDSGSGSGSGKINGHVLVKQMFPEVCERLKTLRENVVTRFNNAPPADFFNEKEGGDENVIEKMKTANLDNIDKQLADYGCS